MRRALQQVMSMTETSTPKPRVGPAQFLREVRAEARKVTWASRKETIAASIMVLVMAVTASIFFLLVDQILGRLVGWIMQIG
jgi:preprotein translocase subunit SecE